MDHAHSARAISSPRGQPPPLQKPTHSLRAAFWVQDESSALAGARWRVRPKSPTRPPLTIQTLKVGQVVDERRQLAAAPTAPEESPPGKAATPTSRGAQDRMRMGPGGDGGDGGDGGGGGDGGDTHLTSTPPDIQLLLPQYCHEPPSSSGQYVLPLLVLISPPVTPV